MRDVYSYSMFYRCAGQPAINVWHFRNDEEDGSNPDSSASDLLDAFQLGFSALLLDCLPEDTFVIGAKVRRVNNSGGPTVVQSYAAAPGNRAGTCSTSSVGPCLIWGYNTGTRWRAGRTFLPGISEDDIEENVIAGDLRTACEDFGTGFIGGLDGTVHDWESVIWQPRAAGGPFTSGIETATVRGIVGTQRRRMLPSF